MSKRRDVGPIVSVKKSEVIDIINSFESLFSSKQEFLKFKNYILKQAPIIIQKHQENPKDETNITILMEIRVLVFKFISKQIKAGDIDLEISLIDQELKRINLIMANYKKWLKEDQRPYLELLRLAKENNPEIEFDFLKSLYEDSIIETIHNYTGQELLSIEILKTFKKQILTIEKDFEKYLTISNNSTRRTI